MKPKEYLLEHGKIKEIGRGRISAENHKFLTEAVANGAKIDGYLPPAGKDSVRVVRMTNAVPKPKPVEEETDIVSDIIYRYPLDTPVHAFIDGKKISVSMREACGNCRVSLVVCTCGAPTVVRPDGRGSMRVYMEGY